MSWKFAVLQSVKLGNCLLCTFHIKHSYWYNFKGLQGSKWGSKGSKCAHSQKYRYYELEICSFTFDRIKKNYLLRTFDIKQNYWSNFGGVQGSGRGPKGSRCAHFQTNRYYELEIRSFAIGQIGKLPVMHISHKAQLMVQF